MIEFVLSFIILLAIVAGMAIGVMKGRAPISGTCGGLNNIGIDGACEICGGNPAKCDSNEETPAAGRSTGFYDASN
ncbi:MAG: (Na+)-NQR maturation NqrM [Pseudomonadales bacterium]|jgi:hypothetical protein|nr:(Na+)-NQR maturation NqrM [Pseudomonadales bacterium]